MFDVWFKKCSGVRLVLSLGGMFEEIGYIESWMRSE